MHSAGSMAEIRKETAAWLVDMDSAPDQWNRADFVSWLKASPLHVMEFLQQYALWVDLQGARPGGIDIGQLIHESGNVIDWPQPNVSQPDSGERRRPWLKEMIAAGVILAAALVLWSGLLTRDTPMLVTAVGEQRAVRLQDGSVLHLNTDSRVEIHFTATHREVRLDRGEAMFVVERDVNRPFRVIADGTVFEALGTQFNVRRRASGTTTLSVLEGRVAVITDRQPPQEDSQNPAGSAATTAPRHSRVPYEGDRPPPPGARLVLGAGEQVRVSHQGSLEEQAIDNVTAWRQRQLVFSNASLAEVAEEVGRYNVRPRLLIEGPALQQRRLNGVFAADDPDSLIQFLEREGLSVNRSGDTVLIRAAR